VWASQPSCYSPDSSYSIYWHVTHCPANRVYIHERPGSAKMYRANSLKWVSLMSSDSISELFPLLRNRVSDPGLPSARESEVKAAGRHLASTTAQSGASDEFLLAEAAKGTKDAIGLLFRRYQRVVKNIAQRILRDETEAEDICQDVFVSLFQKAHLFDASKGRASSWIVQIAYHRAMNRRQYLAHRQHYNTQDFDEEQIGAERQPLIVDEIAARDLLHRLRNDLTREQMETLELHFFWGYSFREIAEKTGQTLGSVRNRYYRGLDRLRSSIFPKKDK